MSAALPDYVDSTVALRRSLEEAAEALAHVDLERLLACETAIHAALTHLSNSQLSDQARAHLAREVGGAQAALARCRRLGGALDDFIRERLSATGFGGHYGPSGASTTDVLHTMQRSA